MVNASPPGVPGWLVIEVKSAMADLHEYVSCAGEFRIENDLAPEKFLVELDALINIRSKDMNMMDVTNQFGLLLYQRLYNGGWLNISSLVPLSYTKITF